MMTKNGKQKMKKKNLTTFNESNHEKVALFAPNRPYAATFLPSPKLVVPHVDAVMEDRPKTACGRISASSPRGNLLSEGLFNQNWVGILLDVIHVQSIQRVEELLFVRRRTVVRVGTSIRDLSVGLAKLLSPSFTCI